MPFDPIAEIQRVLELEAGAIQDCARRFRDDAKQRKSLEEALQHLRGALDRGGKVVVTGVGKSGKIAQKIAATMASTGSLAVFLHPTEGLHGDLGLVSAQDAVLALSYTGNTDELVRLMPSLKSLRVPVVGIGGNTQSKLAEHCDVWIDGSVEHEACPHNLAPTTSTTLALALGDALAMALMQLRGFDAASFAQNHPGGSLGRRLNLRVRDLMHHGDAVPVLAPSASIDEVVVALTSKRLGAVIIAAPKSTKLHGLIVEGDLRRALQHREKFFTFTAADIMTQGPVSIHQDAMAKEALDLMENRPHQIGVLPVVDSEGNWKGLVRIHDLIRAF